MKFKLKAYLNRRALRRPAIIAGGLLLGFIVLNLAVYGIFMNRTYPNTRVANFSIGATNYGAIAKKLAALPLLPKSISLKQHGQSSAIAPAQLGIAVNKADIETAAKHKNWLPIANLFTAHKLPVSLAVDRTALAKKLSAIASTDQNDPVDASITIQNSQFQLASAANGYQLDSARAAAAITRAIRDGKTAVDLPFSTTLPAVTNASLQPTLQQLQAQQAVALSYTYNGKTVRPSAATIAGWYALVNNKYVPQPVRIQAYITQVGAANNIQVQNISAAVAATTAALQKAAPVTFALTAVPPTVCSTNTKSQLILVNITQQHLWACQGPEQVYDSAVTTGAYAIGDITPTGTWHIYAKETDTHLIGPTWNDFVNYWMPFYSDYGFHDAAWQTFPFGGPEYPTQGSHGCVHLPLAAMAWLYNWSRIGTTVTINA